MGFKVLVSFSLIISILGEIREMPVELGRDKGSDFDIINSHNATFLEGIIGCFFSAKMEIEPIGFLFFRSGNSYYIQIFIFFRGKLKLILEEVFGGSNKDSVLRDTLAFYIVKVTISYRGEANDFPCLFGDFLLRVIMGFPDFLDLVIDIFNGISVGFVRGMGMGVGLGRLGRREGREGVL